MKKTILALTLSVISISTNASQFVSLVSVDNAEIKKQVVVEKIGETEKYGSWSNVNDIYDCDAWTGSDPQIRTCFQDQQRTKDIYSVYSDNSESFDERIIENQTINIQQSRTIVNTTSTLTNWNLVGSVYSCGPWVGNARNCKQDQAQNQYFYNEYSDGTKVFSHLTKSRRTINITQTR
ncbi:hypothetical protein VXJ16_002740 [Vibrio vulnificus]|nr:hypothetical protein [Vibrio vulnificus]